MLSLVERRLAGFCVVQSDDRTEPVSLTILHFRSTSHKVVNILLAKSFLLAEADTALLQQRFVVHVFLVLRPRCSFVSRRTGAVRQRSIPRASVVMLTVK